MAMGISLRPLTGGVGDGGGEGVGVGVGVSVGVGDGMELDDEDGLTRGRPAAAICGADGDGTTPVDTTQRSSHRLSPGQLAFLQAFSSMIQKSWMNFCTTKMMKKKMILVAKRCFRAAKIMMIPQ